MGIKDVFSLLMGNKGKSYTYARMLDGSIPVFSNFGNDIYASDIIDRCVSIKAKEMSKLMPKHIRTDGGKQETVNSSINSLLKFGPNPLMTTSDFLSKCTWLYEKKYNCFIYPAYKIKRVPGGTVREYTGFYPLNPNLVELLEDGLGTYYIRFTFNNGYKYTMPYADIIHWRKDFAMNEFLGGNDDGKAKDDVILGTIKTDKVVTQGLDKAVKSSLAVRGVIKINTMLDDDKQEESRRKFEDKLVRSESGIVPLDLKSDYIPIETKPVVVEKTTMEFVQTKILAYTGISFAIYTGKFTDEEYQAFYESELESKIISLGQAFTKTLFTQQELNMGNEVIFYGQKLLFTNTKNKIAVADILGNRGALTDNQLLELFGYPPYEGGDVRRQSLNFIDVDIAKSYQLNRKNNGKEVKEDEGQGED